MFLPVCLLLAVSAASAAENKRLVMHSDLDLATTLGHLQQNLSDVGNKVLQQGSRIAQLEADNQQFKADNKQFKADNKHLNESVTQQGARIAQLESTTRDLADSGKGNERNTDKSLSFSYLHTHKRHVMCLGKLLFL